MTDREPLVEETGQCHELKTWPEPFSLTWDGLKPFEVRWNDRGFQVGDYLTLSEWEPSTQRYTGRFIGATVTCIVRDAWGLPPGLVVMGIQIHDRNMVREATA